jgi:hypothetical protein
MHVFGEYISSIGSGMQLNNLSNWVFEMMALHSNMLGPGSGGITTSQDNKSLNFS